MADKLQGKSAVVTGGGRGIGRGIALALAREGANVVVNDIFRDLDRNLWQGGTWLRGPHLRP